MPPKNITSVAKNIHIPIHEASCCCSTSSNWCTWMVCVSDIDRLPRRINSLRLFGFISISFLNHDGGYVEVVRRRGRGGLPLETLGFPGIHARNRAVAKRPNQIDQRQHVTDSQDRRAGGGHDVQNLKLRRINVVAARHAEIAEDELREKGQIESEKDN